MALVCQSIRYMEPSPTICPNPTWMALLLFVSAMRYLVAIPDDPSMSIPLPSRRLDLRLPIRASDGHRHRVHLDYLSVSLLYSVLQRGSIRGPPIHRAPMAFAHRHVYLTPWPPTLGWRDCGRVYTPIQRRYACALCPAFL